MNFYVEEGDGTGSEAALDAMPLDLYNLDDYGEELSPEEDDFDDDFDEDFEELSDEEFTQLIDGDGGDDEEADADDSCAENSADPEADEWDSLDSEENVFEED